MWRSLFLLVTLLPAFYQACSKDAFAHFTVESGLPNSTVYFIMQDTKGFLWFCTETGVSRFNGNTFENFTLKNGLADNETFKCFEDPAGRIWFLSYNGKLSYYFKGNFYNQWNDNRLSYPTNSGFLINCQADKSGNIWFSTSSGDILKFNNNGVQQLKRPFPQKHHNADFISSVFYSNGGSILKFATDPLMLKLYSLDLANMQLTFLGKRDSIFLKSPKDLFVKGDEIGAQHYFVNENNVVRYNSQTNRFWVLNKGDYGITTRILCVYRKDDHLLLGTAGQGIYKIKVNGTKEYERMLDNETVTSILEETNGTLWVSTHGNGVYCKTLMHKNVATLSNKVSYSISVAGVSTNERILVGGNNGDISIFRNRELERVITVGRNQFNRVHDITDCDHETFLVGTDDSNSTYYNLNTNIQKKLKPYKSSYLDQNKGKWFSSQDVIYKWNGKDLELKYRIVKDNKVTCIAVANDTSIYVGTTNRLLKLAGARTVQRTILSDEVLKTSVTGLQLINGSLWIATHGNGLFRLKEDSVITHFSEATSGLISDVIQRLYDDNAHFIWLATNNGISVLDRNTGRLISNLTVDEGLSSNDIKNIAVAGKHAYIATAAGIDIFNLEYISYSLPAPNVYVTSFRSQNRTIRDPGDSIVAKFTNGFMTIGFSAVALDAPRNIKYAYKFSTDVAWQETSNPQIALFSLAPGKHRLLIRAKKSNSGFGKPTSLLIEVQPLWYQTSLFRITILILAIATIGLLFRMRLLWLRRKEEKENKIRKKISTLESKALTYQMNPHFIFNSLNTIQHYILINEEREALDYVNDFAILIRQILENSKKPFIELGEELDFLKRYLTLERIRYSENFDFEFNNTLGPKFEDVKIPPILLQPILENAIKHGLAGYKDGLITITISNAATNLYVVIEDNGRGYSTGRKQHQKTESTAITVIKERLRLLHSINNAESVFKIEKADATSLERPGTRVELYIPIFK